MPSTARYPNELLLVQKCLQDDPFAIHWLVETYEAPVSEFLVHEGASLEEARKIIHELWVECLEDRIECEPRFAFYTGDAPLQRWLKTSAQRILLRLKRGIPAKVRFKRLAPFLDLIRGAMNAAFQESLEDFQLIKLAHTEGRTQQAASLSEAETWDKVRKKIFEAAFRHLRTHEPWLELTMEDFSQLYYVVRQEYFR